MAMVVQGITSEWINDPPILVYTVTELSSAKLEVWSKHVVAELEAWAQNHADPCRIMFDLSSSGVSMPYLVLTGNRIYQVGITKQGMAVVDNLFENYTHLMIRFVVLVSKNTSGAVAHKHGISPAYEEHCQYHAFFQRGPALEWLAET